MTVSTHHPAPRSRPGSRNGRAKLTPRAVGVIRRLYAEGYEQKSIAERFSVHKATIWQIVHRITWRQV